MGAFRPQRISDARVRERTGKPIAAWWAQAIAVQYEYARGLRRPLSDARGARQAHRRRTL